MLTPKFVHLRVHTEYSLLDGLSKPKDFVKQSVYLDMPAIAITDFFNLYGVIKFYRYAYHYGIKPVIGVDFKILCKKNKDFNNITILASNNHGYQNLIKLISLANKYKKNNHIFITRELLIKYKTGLILISGGLESDIGKCILRKDHIILNDYIYFYNKHFYNNYYLEIIRTEKDQEEFYLKNIINISRKNNIPIVATNQVCFLEEKDFNAHLIRVSIQKGIPLSSFDKKLYSKKQFLRSEKEMCELFSDIPESLYNSVEISKRCNVTINSNKYFLPIFPTKNISAKNILILKSHKGLKKRLNEIYKNKKDIKKKQKRYFDRLNLELKIINKMKFPGYFLIVMEFIQWAKKNNIPVGPGRGSGAGSLVAYSLNITEVNPLFFNLLFERFLNPERTSLPDFDIDFCMEKRDQVINYVIKKYGEKFVSQIITFGTMTAKAVIRDVGRCLGYTYGFINKISQLIPNDQGIKLKKILYYEKNLLSLYKNNKDINFLINMSLQLEGVIRNIGKHAGGLVISPHKITNFLPLYYDDVKGKYLTQFDKNDIEYIGLLKFDFLGLKTLTIINNTVKMINKNYKTNNININNIPLNDEKSFKILQECKTTAVFQLESYGMKCLIKRLQPDCFEDIISLVALFRPGPLQSGMVDNFIFRKRGLEPIYYPDIKWQHRLLKPILKSTYGIILYQEQVMQIAQVLSGYTPGSADLLRRAMSKKDLKEMKKHYSIFQKGAKKNNIDSKLSSKIFELLEKFAGYGFNKSHSAAYALVSYQTLWLKTHYPAEFMSSVMNSEMDNINRIVFLIDECKKIGIKILKPDINYSKYKFYVNKKNEIVYGLGSIKGLGSKIIKKIIITRKKYGFFYNIFDLCYRIYKKKTHRNFLEKLIFSGCCDSFNISRPLMFYMIPNALLYATQKSKSKKNMQIDMFGLTVNNSIKNICNSYKKIIWPKKIVLDKEKEMLGFYLSSHPIKYYKNELKNYVNFQKIKRICDYNNKKATNIVGLIFSYKVKNTKNNKKICIINFDDGSAKIEIVVFEETFKKYNKIIKKNNLLIIKGFLKFDKYKNVSQFIAIKITDIDDMRNNYIKKIKIYLNKKQIEKEYIDKISKIINSYLGGNINIYLIYVKDEKLYNKKEKNILNKFSNIKVKESLLNELRMLLGKNKIIFFFIK
ncbi:DNA polymerase III subunit alpha [Buchnera aphidicola (Taiwanaphis decaspermi)]|uniref:DNA polymerase III subunit alpha n=1 Tax=Buchnera aphidicola TaxID=9 RepID=UPI0031B81323